MYAEQDLLLVGGGHTHTLLIKRLAMNPIAGLRVTLVSDTSTAAYSGMLPGVLAGHYTREETCIDLAALCQRANVRWVQGELVSLDVSLQQAQLKGQAAVEYDLLSLDTGCLQGDPELSASTDVMPVKPINQLHRNLDELIHTVERGDFHLAVVGGGAGGVELALALAHRFRGQAQAKFSLLASGQSLLPSFPSRAGRIAHRQLRSKGVDLVFGFRAKRFEAGVLYDEQGAGRAVDKVLLCTGARAPSWPARSELACDDHGFIAVHDTLQSVSHSNVFAVGDLASLSQSPRPKAGVFAVRQAPMLYENLSLYVQEKTLKKVSLQSDYLRLLSLGEKKAIAVRNGISHESALAWKWKDWIDRRFMDQFSALNTQQAGLMNQGAHSAGEGQVAAGQAMQSMRCAGCGSKIAPQSLRQNLNVLEPEPNASACSTVQAWDDAASWPGQGNYLEVQSIDGFRSFSDDLYRFGQITVNHAFNDLYAMGAEPRSAQAWANVAFAAPSLQRRDHLRMMQGVAAAVAKHSATLLGGHSTEGAEAHLGIVASGRVLADQVWRKSGAQVGDTLLLSKSLGTGVILAAQMQGAASAFEYEAAILSMLESPADYRDLISQLKPNAATDVSGFGLLGHLLEMLEASGVDAELDSQAIALLPGALRLARAGFASTLQPSLQPYQRFLKSDRSIEPSLIELLTDPQTSGGLILSVPSDYADQVLQQAATFVKVGHVTARPIEKGSNAQLVLH